MKLLVYFPKSLAFQWTSLVLLNLRIVFNGNFGSPEGLVVVWWTSSVFLLVPVFYLHLTSRTRPKRGLRGLRVVCLVVCFPSWFSCSLCKYLVFLGFRCFPKERSNQQPWRIDHQRGVRQGKQIRSIYGRGIMEDQWWRCNHKGETVEERDNEKRSCTDNYGQ